MAYTSSTCAGPIQPRNILGFTRTTTSDCCSRPVRVPVTPDLPGQVQAVDTLIVRQELVTNQQRGGTLTLTGSGTVNPTFEAALCVTAGARIDGLSEHGALRVRGNSCMKGPWPCPTSTAR